MTIRATNKAVRLDGRSPVRSVVLAVVVERPGYGYQIASRAEHRVGYLWSIDRKHVYSHLKWLRNSGFLRSEQVHFERPPYLRDVYYPTEDGIAARNEWLAAPLVRRDARTNLEVRLLFSALADIPVLLRVVGECRAWLTEEIEQNQATHTAPVSHLATMMNLQRSAIDKCLKAEVEWLGEVRAELEGLRDQSLSR